MDHGVGAELRRSGIPRGLLRGAGGCQDFLLKLGRVGKHWPTSVRLDPLQNAWKESILLTDVLVTPNVHQVDDRLRAHEQVLVEDFDLLPVPLAVAYRNLLDKQFLAAAEKVAFLSIRSLVHARNNAIQFLAKSVQVLNILLEELVRDDLQVSDRVHITLVMHDFFVGERPHDMEDAINSLNVR